MFHKVADVVVTDGFVGNVLLKTAEGMVSAMGEVIKDTLLRRNIINLLGTALLAPSLRGLRRRFDYETYGGAPLLGVRGNCIYTHGRVCAVASRARFSARSAKSNTTSLAVSARWQRRTSRAKPR